MKKIKSFFAIVAVCFMAMFSFVGCGGSQVDRHLSSDPTISSELELQIRQTYSDNYGLKIKNIYIVKYYGTFGDSVVITTNWDGYDMAVIITEDIGGVLFEYANWFIAVWREAEGRLSLKNAYEQGYLTVENLIAINERYKEPWN